MSKTQKSSITKNTFNERLKKINMNHKVFAKKTGIAYTTINNWKEIPFYSEVLLEKFELDFLLSKAIKGEVNYELLLKQLS